MGRRKQKKYYKKKNQAQDRNVIKSAASADGALEAGPNADNETSEWVDESSASASGGLPGWTWKERRSVLKFLEQYKFGCECVYAGVEPDSQTIPITIGVVEFPLLTRDALEQPYLCLPDTLTAKNRKLIHECCAESFLFHITVGERHTIHNRTLAISIYVDGFDSIPNLDQHMLPRVPIMAPPRVPTQRDKDAGSGGETKEDAKPLFYHPLIHNYRPWYAQKNRPWLLDSDSSNNRTTPPQTSLDRAGKNLVDALIDNPETCLRDDLDVFDFSLWDKADLSNVSPPASSTMSTTTNNGNSNENHQNQNHNNNHNNEWTLVDTPEKMKACIASLQASQPTEIGFDLESLNKNKFCQLTCLLQITSNAVDDGHNHHDYVIDTLAPGVWDLVGPGLAPLFANPRIVKVGHSIGGLDVRSLHRDFGIFVVNAFDTYEAAKVLGLDSLGLASVCAHYGMVDSDHYKELKAEYQATDWRLRPLTKPMLEYGRYDVHYLLRLRWLLIRDLTRAELYDRTQSERDEEAVRVATTMASALAQFNEDEDEENDENWNLPSAPATNGAETPSPVALDGEREESFDYDDEKNDPGYFDSDEDDDYGENDFGGSNDPVLSPQNPKASAALLRMQPNLMKAISRSQDRCRDLWAGKEEPYLTHPMYIDILHRARRDEVIWTPEHLKLYKKLIEWRNQYAEKYEILPGFVAPLEFLIPVALQRPRSLDTLRRVSYRFPELLEEDKDCQQSLLELVRQTVAEDPTTDDSDEALLKYQKPDPRICARIHRKKQEKIAKQRRRKSRSFVELVDWKSAGVVLVAVVAVFAMTAHRWRKK